jgi:hypothetical protein
MAVRLKKEAKSILKRVLERMKSAPQLIDMDSWVREGNSCGTTACIAGNINVECGFPVDFQTKMTYMRGSLDDFLKTEDAPKWPESTQRIPKRVMKKITDPGDLASALLGLKWEVTRNLFFVHNWPQRFRFAYEQLETQVNNEERIHLITDFARPSDRAKSTRSINHKRRAMGLIAIERFEHFVAKGE